MSTIEKKATASNLPHGKKQADETLQAGPPVRAHRRAAAWPEKRRCRPQRTVRRWCSAPASHHHVVGFLLNPGRRMRIGWPSRTQGWTVNEILTTLGRWPTAASATRGRAGSPGAGKRGQEDGEQGLEEGMAPGVAQQRRPNTTGSSRRCAWRVRAPADR